MTDDLNPANPRDRVERLRRRVFKGMGYEIEEASSTTNDPEDEPFNPGDPDRGVREDVPQPVDPNELMNATLRGDFDERRANRATARDYYLRQRRETE